jgi:hypothetical protein
MATLVWQRTTYSDGNQEYPAVYVRRDDVTAYLGRPHDGDPEQDECLVQGLLESGAPTWVQDAPGWIDEHGWGLYRPDSRGQECGFGKRQKVFWLMEPTDSFGTWRHVVPVTEVRGRIWAEDLLEITCHQARTAEEIDDLAEKLTTKYREDNPADLGSWLGEMGYDYHLLRGYIDPENLLVFDGADNSFQNLDYYPTDIVYEYLDSRQNNWQYFVIQDQEGNLFADRIVVSEEFVDLDEWDGSNWRTGGVGLHEQVHKVLKVEGEAVDGMYLVYRWSQWQGQQPDALLLTKEELADHLEELGRDVEEYLSKIAELDY